MDSKNIFQEYVVNDDRVMRMLRAVRELHLPDWFLAAGAIRNSIWDILEEFPKHTDLNDVDVVYFDDLNIKESHEKEFEVKLKTRNPLFPWSVKNQSRMAKIYNDRPYKNTCDGIAHWPETPTCVGVRLETDNRITICAPFGVEDILRGTVKINPKWPRPEDFKRRMKEKQWDKIWPGVQYIGI